MADKTKNSGVFSIEISNLKIRNLRSQAIYNVDQQGVVKGTQVNLLKQITKAQYDALPDNLKSEDTKTALRFGEPPQTVDFYYAILATKKEDERKYTPNKEVLNTIPLARGATDVSTRDIELFKKEIANYNEKGQGQFLNVNRNAQIVINKEEGFKDNDKRNQTGLAGNAAQPPQDPPNTGKPPDRAIKGNLRRNYEILKYPENLSDKQDYIQFLMYEYGAKNYTQTTTKVDNKDTKITTGFGRRDNILLGGSVTLPIQNQITDENRVDWGAGDINPLQAFTARSLYGIDISNVAGGLAQAEADARATFKSGSDDLATFARTYFIQQAVQTKNLLSRTTGAILNPNVELLFNRPQLRPFTFKFFLAARSDTEAIQVKKIIRFFKQGMSVKETATDIFLKAPNIFKIKYRYGKDGTDHPGLNRIKDCALTSCSVDYTPNNSYMTFEDGTMTAYAITLQFQELEPITETDYTGSADSIPAVPPNEIGF